MSTSLRRFFAFVFCSRAYGYLPIFVVWLRDSGYSQVEVVLLINCYFLSALLAEIPTGLLADRWGRTRTLTIGSLAQAVGAALLAIPESLALLVTAEVLLGVGYACHTGAKEAFLYDQCAAHHRGETYQRIYAESKFFEFAAMSLGGIGGAVLYLWHARAPFIVTALVFLVSAALAASLAEPPMGTTTTTVRYRELRGAWRDLTGAPLPLWQWMAFYAWFFSAILAITVTMSQPYLRSIGIPLTHFGWLFAVYHGLAMLGAYLARRRTATSWSGAVTGGIGFLLLCLALAHGHTPMSAVVLGGVFLGWGLLLPICSQAVNRYVPAAERATVLSFQDAAQNAVFIGLATGLGYGMDRVGLPAACTALGLVSGLVLLALWGMPYVVREATANIPRNDNGPPVPGDPSPHS